MIKKITFAGVGLILLASPLVASADQISDIQAQVQALLQRIAGLQAQSTSPQPPIGFDDESSGGTGGTSSACPNLTMTLTKGMRDANTGGQVSELQDWLASYYGLGNNFTSGYFGVQTVKYVTQFQRENGIEPVGFVGRQTRAAIARVCGGTKPSDPITVTAPNGGEQWEIGQLNTITWSPYGYNPDVNPAKDVNVFLERVDGSTAGQVMDTGKASLHTYFNIGGYDNWAEPGQYYIRASKRLTGATDRSDAPFTLLPRGVDIKVNGSDGPITLSDNQPVTVIFNIGATFSSCMLNGVRESINGGPGVEFGSKYPIGSAFSGYAHAPNPGSSTAISVTCTKLDGSMRGDSVQVNIEGGVSSIRVVSPNGGEQFKADGTGSTVVQWKSTGVKSASVALYKNDMWAEWIAKDVVTQPGSAAFLNVGSDTYGVNWNPYTRDDLATAGNVFKIYITGQKADGSGYVDDRSDAPFGFMSSTGSVTITVSSTPGAQSFAAGSQNVTVANILFDASRSNEDMTFPGVLLLYTTNVPNALSNCAAYSGSTRLNSGLNTVNPVYVPTASASQLFKFTFDNPRFLVLKGRVTTISIKCNISSAASGATFSWGLQSGSSIAGTGRTYGYGITPTVINNPGSTMTVSGGGALIVGTDASSPSYAIAAGGSSGVVMGVVKLRPSGEGVNLKKVGLTLIKGTYSAAPGAQDLGIVSMYLGDGVTKVGTAIFVGNAMTATSTLTSPVSLPRDVDTKLIIKADLANIGASQPATPGDLIKIDVANVEGNGASSATTIRGGNSAGLTAFNGVRIFRSYPTVALGSLPSTGLSDSRLIRFSVKADPAGDIGIGKFTFGVNSQGNITPDAYVYLYAFTDSSYSMPVSGQGAGGLIGSAKIEGTAVTAVIGPNAPLLIPRGQSYYLELRGDAGKGVGIVDANTVTTTLYGDSVAGVQLQSGIVLREKDINFVWSPNDTFNFSQFSDTDWTNGYGIPGLSPSGISQTRTGSGTPPTPTPTSVTITSPTAPQTLSSRGAITLTWDAKSLSKSGEMVTIQFKRVGGPSGTSGMPTDDISSDDISAVAEQGTYTWDPSKGFCRPGGQLSGSGCYPYVEHGTYYALVWMQGRPETQARSANITVPVEPDEARVETLNTRASALEAYKASGGLYPVSNWSSSLQSGNAFSKLDVPVPVDSGPGQCNGSVGDNSSTARAYWYISADGSSYKMTACSENIVPASDPYYDAVRPGYVFTKCGGTSACSTFASTGASTLSQIASALQAIQSVLKALQGR